ncbi:MAG: ABC transporter ATP-binding protein [Firmicutes bacterium]|jgi:ATP-binding cassette subfamily B multidrug efflux pump|nr:ABC transporter ATP-binding protein [Bacillota bacterium]
MAHEMEQERHTAPLNRGLLLRLLKYLSPHKGRVAIAILLMLGVSVTTITIPYLAKLLIDDHITVGNTEGLNRIALVMVLLFLSAWVFSYLRGYVMASMGQGIIYTMRQELYGHLQKLSLRYYDSIQVGRLITRLTSDIDALNELLSGGVINFISDSVTLVGIAAIMLAMNPRLAALTFITIPFLGYMMTGFRMKIFLAQRQVREKVAAVNASLQENISGVRVTQAFTREKENLHRFSEVNRASYNAAIHSIGIFSYFWPTIDFISAVGTVIVLWFGGRWLLQEQLTVGEMVAFLGYTGQFFGPLRNLGQLFRIIQTAMAGAERVFGILDTVPEIQDRPDAKELPPIQGHVKFENVTFAYEGEDYVLREINLEVEPGQTIALVGHTGAGKTSMINILCRFYDVTGGRILMDGYDLREVTQKSLRSQIGLVLQEPFLFSGTIRENLLYGNPRATEEDMLKVTKALGLHGFIQEFPDGYDTQVQERGSRLSLGQRQLVSFARAIINDPRILILDEATANIDTQTEQIIQKALEHMLAGRTSFVIAHRLTTIQRADRIIVIDSGRIVESGTHEELLAQNGIYRRLYMVQFRHMSQETVLADESVS